MNTEKAVVVRVDDSGMPTAIYRRKWDGVRILEYWMDTGSWWAGEREKEFYRLLTSRGAVVEVYQESGQWHLYKIYD